MTSPKQENSPRGWPHQHLIPELEDEVKAQSVGGVYKIELPNQIPYNFPAGDQGSVPSIQLRCRSLFTKRPNIVSCCNSVVKTVVGKGSGDQTELIECGRCRTAYLVRTKYDENGNPDIRVKIYDTGRNIKQYSTLKRDANQDVWVSFNSDSDK